MAVFSTALAVPLLLIEVAGGADASPDPRPTAYVTEAAESEPQPDAGNVADAAEVPRGLGVVTGDDLAVPRTLGVFGLGDQLRAEAAAEEAEAAERARAAEEEQLRLREEREAAAEAARKAEQERIARERAAEAEAAQAAAEAAVRTQAEAAAGGPSAAQWQALRQCESGGNYQAVSGNGLYRGAYQFYQGTWDNIARATGRTDLVGVAPDHASPADQDALALALYQSRGHRPWPHCGSHLR